MTAAISGGLRGARAVHAAAVVALLLGCAGGRPGSPGSTVEAPSPPDGGGSAAHGPPHVVAPEPARVTTVARASLAAIGDVLMHGAVKEAAADHRAPGNDEGFGWLWAPIADLLSASDVTFANLETPVAPRAGQGARSFVFNAPPAVVRALRGAGVKVVSVANNHMFDQGRAGFEETLSQLDQVGMPYVGGGEAGRESGPRILGVNGLRLAFLGYSYGFNQSGNTCPPPHPGGPRCLKASLLEADRAVEEVRAAARNADAVVVSVHWGEEYREEPREAQVALAHRLAEAGALVVLGHHPHVLQPIELYASPEGRITLIAYSLGNFVSNQSRKYVQGVTPEREAATRQGVLLRTEIVRRDYGGGVVRVELGRTDWLPLWTENDTVDPARAARGARPAIRVVSVDRALAKVRAELSSFAQPVPTEAQSRYLELKRREDLFVTRRAAIAAVLGDDLQAEAPPEPSPRPGVAGR